MDDYRQARIDGLESALAILALVTLLALFAATRLPRTQPGDALMAEVPAAPPSPA